MRERNIKDGIRLAIRKLRQCVTFSNPVGVGWTGKMSGRDGGITKLMGASQLRYGLAPGSPDLVGWLPVVIRPEHVGKKIAIFVGLEVKTPTGRVRDDQKSFLSVLDADGGICGIVRSEEDALNLIDKAGF